MINYVQVMKEINEIISFCMLKGVQPQDLITSIFETEYQSIETYKKGDLVHLILTYNDIHDDGSNIIKMKYIYNSQQQLLSISQKIDSFTYKTQWDRSSKIEEMLTKLKRSLPNDSKVISKIREAIPEDFQSIFHPHLRLVS